MKPQFYRTVRMGHLSEILKDPTLKLTENRYRLIPENAPISDRIHLAASCECRMFLLFKNKKKREKQYITRLKLNEPPKTQT